MKKSLDAYLLVIFVAFASFLAIIYAAQFFHILPAFLGPGRFFSTDWLGGLVWGLGALAGLRLVAVLLAGDTNGLAYATWLALVNMALGLATLLGGTAFRVLLPAYILNGLVLVYAALPGTKKIFKR